MRHLAGTLVLVAALLLAACGDDDGSSSASTAAATTPSTTATATDGGACAKDQLSLTNAGRLTIATDKPAYPPYFVDDEPANGKGFESAVAYGIADELGFDNAEVTWTVVPFNSSYAPGPKKFDFDVNQISITPARAKRVDFSTPYFTAPQAVVAKNASKGASATTLAELAGAKIGVQVGTTSLDAVKASIQPSGDIQVFDTSNDVVNALKQGKVDAVVVDLPTAFYLTSAELENAKIVGQFASPGGDPWGALLAKDSELTPCVNAAVDRLKSSGKLKEITDRWLGGDAGAPELK
jgi:polar amino acid transport system substrate-binding protein